MVGAGGGGGLGRGGGRGGAERDVAETEKNICTSPAKRLKTVPLNYMTPRETDRQRQTETETVIISRMV